MPLRFTMSDLRTRAQRRCDMEGDPLITATVGGEWNQLISEAYGELYTIVFEAGLEYFETAKQYTTTGAQTLAEAPDHLSTVALAYLIDPVLLRYVGLRELMAQERIMMSGTTVSGGSFARAFALVDDQIYLYPTPPSGQIYELRYVPQPPDMTNYADNALIDVVTPDGLSFLLWNVAVMAMAKSEGDPQLAMARLEAARDRFTTSVQLRALNAPRRRILDVETDVGDGEWADRLRW